MCVCVCVCVCVILIGCIEEGSYLSGNRNSPKSERIENAPLGLISTEQFNSMLVLGSAGENVHRFEDFLLIVCVYVCMCVCVCVILIRCVDYKLTLRSTT